MRSHLLLPILAVALAAGVPSSAAQSLPDWAAPSPPPPKQPQETRVPDPPNGGGAPAQVPVDGGLGLLALAGGAYAARRLRA